MIGPFLGLLVTLAVAALVGWGFWAMKRRSVDPDAEAGRPVPSPDVPPAQAVPVSRARGLAADLERWVAAGLITSEQAESIRAHERAAAAARPPAGERRISLIAEALGYVGTALALAGAAVGLGQAWEDIPAWGRLAVAAGATVLLLLGGAILLRQTEPAFRRLQSVLWFLAVGAGVWFLVVLAVEYLGLEDDERMMLLVGAGSAVLAGLLWAVRRDALQHAALFATLLAALVGAVLCLPGEAPIWLYALVVWALGVAWGLAGWFTAVFLMAVSVPTGQVPLLAVGTLGTFGYLTWAVFHFFGDSLSVPVVLVIIGAVFIALAVVAGRLTQVTRGRRLRSGGEPTTG
jgi:hypothetical protein